jgi:hypothetical protein
MLMIEYPSDWRGATQELFYIQQIAEGPRVEWRMANGTHIFIKKFEKKNFAGVVRTRGRGFDGF